LAPKDCHSKCPTIKIDLQKSARFVDYPFNGVKNGKKYGTKCFTVPKNAEKIKIKPNQHRLNQLAVAR
jgi:hypothetical protein